MGENILDVFVRVVIGSDSIGMDSAVKRGTSSPVTRGRSSFVRMGTSSSGTGPPFAEDCTRFSHVKQLLRCSIAGPSHQDGLARP